MATRKGLAISVKMILTTTALILLTVVGFGALNTCNLRDAYDRAAREKISTFQESVKTKGALTTQIFSKALEKFLIDNADAEIVQLVGNTLKQDEGLSLIYVVSRDQQLIAFCQRRGDTCDRGGYPAEMHVPPTHASWTKALATWQDRAAHGVTNPFVDVELPATDGAPRMEVFAAPIFINVAPTAAAAAAPTAGDNRQGYVVFGYDLSPVEKFARDSARDKKAAASKAVVRTAGVGILFVLIGTLLAIFQGLQISKPIKSLAWRADQIARGDLNARVDVTSTDEIGVLGENFNYMADQIAVLLTQAADKATLEKELEVARAIQETLVPSHEPIDKGNLKLAGYFQPASTCGGDWWTWHDLTEGRLLVVIGDVTGHGVPSAMITAAAKAACDVARREAKDDVDPAKLLEIMNSAIYQSAKRKFVMTCFASVIDTAKRTITYANAGHNFPYLYRATEGGGEFGSLMIRGNRLGDLADSTYELKTTELQAGDLLVWYTDGIVECESETGEEYGEKRFRASVRRAAALDAAEIRDAVVSDAAAYFGDAVRKDDITLVLA
ncbi:MAG TPA: SpoIIE family protein phosphatase, partial [Kofleriaceae bacterium]|nr:SpoIIE family protein phosphatase [Kofleriaceae bacterium]